MKSLLACLAIEICMKHLYLALLFLSCFASASEKGCADYQIGESRKFSDHAVIGFFGAPEQSYQVTKLPDNKYLLEVNPQFYELITKISPLGVAENVPQKVSGGRARVKECFAWFNQKFSASMNPQILLGVSESPRPIKINVMRDLNFRGYMKKYSVENMNDCSLIVHESLHLMGLWDEYVESDTSDSTGLLSFNCRSISNSIMSERRIYSGDSFPKDEHGSSLAPLRPAHLRQLLYPSCAERNPVYKACISSAYRSVGTIFNCNPAPAVCGEKNVWLE